MVVFQSAHMCHQCSTSGVVYEILGFVGSYNLQKCVLLLLICSYNFVLMMDFFSRVS